MPAAFLGEIPEPLGHFGEHPENPRQHHATDPST